MVADQGFVPAMPHRRFRVNDPRDPVEIGEQTLQIVGGK
jgi:hypothetical protein